MSEFKRAWKTMMMERLRTDEAGVAEYMRMIGVKGGAAPHSPRRLKTHCTKGHKYTPNNTIVKANGKRTCRQCNKENCRRYRAKKQQATPSQDNT